MRFATAPTGCSLRRCSLRTDGCQRTPTPLLKAGVPTGARRSTPRRRAHDTDRHHKGVRDEARPQRGDSPAGNVPVLLARTVAPHAWAVGPRHTPPSHPVDDRPATPGTRSQAGLRATLSLGRAGPCHCGEGAWLGQGGPIHVPHSPRSRERQGRTGHGRLWACR
jgi:hypothetical protein